MKTMNVEGLPKFCVNTVRAFLRKLKLFCDWCMDNTALYEEALSSLVKEHFTHLHKCLMVCMYRTDSQYLCLFQAIYETSMRATVRIGGTETVPYGKKEKNFIRCRKGYF
ncbi:hypothetical protein FNH22_12015 [Fulvivirga sp. M361]|uniref:hypothetical protein n=1 Tax=Fulvivirga sp. M361 TaxID=2594266 RepID=UPI00117A9D1D|nr:hypothetical protein [Fulvivirga sp. M361]TRX58600.1 hypothetical protein FNH22_12015 [Fulvivirga sp. M361]